MAIQLSERDQLIFRFIEEHQVLLEKHIAWFISCDEKPVLIRDRLRKLFYLDYLLCERHGGKLPWWTTPTKPLVYMLSPMTRQLMNAADCDYELSECDVQRHLLEVANLRMLFLVDQKESLISEFKWTTAKKKSTTEAGLDAVVSFKRNDVVHRIGIINQPTAENLQMVADIEKSLDEGKIDSAWVVSRDEAHQQLLQRMLLGTAIASKVAFTTHQEIYKFGVVKAKWQSSAERYASVVAESVADSTMTWAVNLTPAPAF